MSKTSLRERKKQKARAAILQAAAELFERHGYTDARMRDIAQRAEVSYQTLYNYFPTKARIAEALLGEEIAALSAKIGETIEGYRVDLLSVLHHINQLRLDFFWRQDPALWRQLTIDLMQRDSDAEALYQRVDSAAHERLTALLRKGQRLGELDSGADAEVMAHAIYALSEYAMVMACIDDSTSSDKPPGSSISAKQRGLSESLTAQINLLVQPYVRQPAIG